MVGASSDIMLESWTNGPCRWRCTAPRCSTCSLLYQVTASPLGTERSWTSFLWGGCILQVTCHFKCSDRVFRRENWDGKTSALCSGIQRQGTSTWWSLEKQTLKAEVMHGCFIHFFLGCFRLIRWLRRLAPTNRSELWAPAGWTRWGATPCIKLWLKLPAPWSTRRAWKVRQAVALSCVRRVRCHRVFKHQ